MNSGSFFLFCYACVRSDKVWIKVAGKQKYLFVFMDDQTRYWLASDMADTKFQHNANTWSGMTKKIIGKNPKYFIFRGLSAHMKSSRKVFDSDTRHSRYIHLCKDMNNNKIGSLNGRVRNHESLSWI